MVLNQTNVAVLGTGAWATALACCSSLNGNDTKLWGIEDTEIADINNGYNVRCFGKTPLFAKLWASRDLEIVLDKVSMIIIAVPSPFVEDVVQKFLGIINNLARKKDFSLNRSFDVVNVTKGFDPKTHDVWSKTIKRHFSASKFCFNLVSLIGPSFATEVIKQRPTAVNVVSADTATAERVAKVLATDFFFTKVIDDEIGAQVLSALKNFLAIIVGMWDAAFNSTNTHAMILTLGIEEIRKMGNFFCINPKTILDFCGIGDIILTCSSKESRNFTFGTHLYQSNSLQDTLEKHNATTVEGYNLWKIIANLIQQNQLDLPLFQSLVSVLSGTITPRESIRKFCEYFRNS